MIRKLLCISALLTIPAGGCVMAEPDADPVTADASKLGAEACTREICYELDANDDGQLDQLDLVKILQDCTAEDTVECVPLVTGSASGQQTLVLALSRGLDPANGPHLCAAQPSCDHWPLMFDEPADLEAHTAAVAEDDLSAYASEATGKIDLAQVTVAERPVVSASGAVYAATDIPDQVQRYLRLFDDGTLQRKRMLEAYARLEALNWGSEAHRYLAEAYFDDPQAGQEITADGLQLIQQGGCLAECTLYFFPRNPGEDDAKVGPQPFRERVEGQHVADCPGAITDAATPHEVLAECPAHSTNGGGFTSWPFAYAQSEAIADAQVKMMCAFLGDCAEHGCTATGWYEADFINFDAEAHVDGYGGAVAGVSGTAPVGRLATTASSKPRSVTVSAKAEAGTWGCWGEYEISEECVLTVGLDWSPTQGFGIAPGAECSLPQKEHQKKGPFAFTFCGGGGWDAEVSATLAFAPDGPPNQVPEAGRLVVEAGKVQSYAEPGLVDLLPAGTQVRLGILNLTDLHAEMRAAAHVPPSFTGKTNPATEHKWTGAYGAEVLSRLVLDSVTTNQGKNDDKCVLSSAPVGAKNVEGWLPSHREYVSSPSGRYYVYPPIDKLHVQIGATGYPLDADPSEFTCTYEVSNGIEDSDYAALYDGVSHLKKGCQPVP